MVKAKISEIQEFCKQELSSKYVEPTDPEDSFMRRNMKELWLDGGVFNHYVEELLINHYSAKQREPKDMVKIFEAEAKIHDIFGYDFGQKIIEDIKKILFSDPIKDISIEFNEAS